MRVEKREYTHAEQAGIMYQLREMYGAANDTDSYKYSHHCQYIKGATRMLSYIESRGGKFDQIVWFGAQMLIKEYLLQRITKKHVKNIMAFARKHMMGNIADDLEIALNVAVDEYEGKWPVIIKSAPEGLVIPVKNVILTIETSVDDTRIFSLVSFLETKLLRVWSPMTVATLSWHIRQFIYEKLQQTADAPDAEINFKLHDFGSRGASSEQTVMYAGAGHLVSFMGSDSTAAISAAMLAYNCEMPAYSIPASEHSTTTSWGRGGEENLVNAMFDNYAKPGALFATVIDSYKALDFIRVIAPKYKQRLIDSGATWVFRPDSSDSVEMPVKCVIELEKIFGCTVNSKGYKVLNNVRVIQGDGISFDEVKLICNRLIELGYSISNMAFGMGGGLLQKNDRDTQKVAMKCCAVLVNGEWLDVYKDPTIYDSKTWEPIITTEANFKTSKRGRLELMHNAQTGAYETMTSENVECYEGKFGWEKVLVTTYENGYLVEEWQFDEVRLNALKPVKKTTKPKVLHGDYLIEGGESAIGLDKKPAVVLEK